MCCTVSGLRNGRDLYLRWVVVTLQVGVAKAPGDEEVEAQEPRVEGKSNRVHYRTVDIERSE